MTWPKLSVQLTGPKSPQHCQSCGKPGWLDRPIPTATPTLHAWQEHDANDQPTPVVVVLCKPCEDRLIEPHPRLYGRLEPWTPHPGIMVLCLDCNHGKGVSCLSPRARMNGGDGITVSYPKPSHVHILRRGKGQRSGWITRYSGPPSRCDGKEQIEP